MIKFFLETIVAMFIVVFFAQNSLIYYANVRFGSSFGVDEILADSPFNVGGEIFSAFDNDVRDLLVLASNKISHNDEISQNVALQTPLAKTQIKDEILVVSETNNTAPEIKISDEKEKLLEAELEKIANAPLIIAEQNASAPEQNSTTVQNFAPKIEANATTEVSAQSTQTVQKAKNPNDKIHIKGGNTVLFIGDSLMQYVGMNAKKLFPKKNLKVVDLSKQSTGLMDKKGHNWQKVLAEALDKTPNVALVVVLLGANDPHPRKLGGVVRNVNTSQWQEFYATRVREIYDTSHKYGAKVLWLGLPCMQQASFAQKTEILNKIYKSVNSEFGQFFMATTPLVCENGMYKIYLKGDKKELRVRQDDGIHMSTQGSAKVARKILSRIEVD